MVGLRLGLKASILLLLTSTVHALHFTPDSECAALCSGGSNTTSSSSDSPVTRPSDVVCEDDEYSDSGNGIRFKNCLNCLQKSDTALKKESDVYWFLCKSATNTSFKPVLLLMLLSCRQCPICFRRLSLLLPRCSGLGYYQLSLQY
jgi:hypothetical protein